MHRSNNIKHFKCLINSVGMYCVHPSSMPRGMMPFALVVSCQNRIGYQHTIEDKLFRFMGCIFISAWLAKICLKGAVFNTS